MSDIVNIEAYSPEREEYVRCEVWVDMQAHGVNSWGLKSVDGLSVDQDDTWSWVGIDPITYYQVDAAARLQLRNER